MDEDVTNDTPKKKKRSKPDWRPRFLKMLSKTGNIKQSCEAAHVERVTVYRNRDSDPVFAEAMVKAFADSVDDLDAEARRRAQHGVDKPIVYKGEIRGIWVDQNGSPVADGTAGARFIPATVKEYSDTLIIFLLKAHGGDKYRDKVDCQHSGNVQQTHTLDLSKLTNEQLRQLLDLRRMATEGIANPGDFVPPQSG